MHGRLKDIHIADYYICSTKIMLTVYIYIHFSVNLEQKKARIVFEVDKEVTNQKVQISFCAIPPSPRQSPSLIVQNWNCERASDWIFWWLWGSWRRIVNVSSSVICSKHFSKVDIVGQKLQRVDAIPIQEEFVLIQTGAYINNYDQQKSIFGRAKKT